MKKSRLVILLGSICLVLIMAVSPFMAACAKPAPPPAPAPVPAPAPAPAPAPPPPPPPPKPIELKGVTMQPPMAFRSQLQKSRFYDKVTEAAKGELVIKYLGGPEVIGLFEQAEAVKRGALDIAILPTAMFIGLVPQAFPVLLSRVGIKEKLERGYYDFLQPFYNKVGLYFLGDMTGDPKKIIFYIFVNKKVERLEDLAGLRLGGASPAYKRFVEAFGATLIVTTLPESYPAIEQGLADGWIYPVESVTAYGTQKILKYCIDHPFWVDNSAVIVNLDKWNSLPKHLQNVMRDTLFKIIPEMDRAMSEQELKDRQKCLDAGMKFIKLPPEDAERYIKVIYDTTWKWQIELLPEVGPKLKEMLSP